MDRVTEALSIQDVTRQEVSRYVAVDTAKMAFYPIFDDLNQSYVVMIVPRNADDRPAWAFVLARIVGDYIVIEEDGPADKPLHEALMVNAGVPRAKIILAYKGEQIPTVEQS